MSTETSGVDAEAYADNAPLMALFGTPARTKIVSVFVAERGRDLSKSEIARGAGISRSTVYEHLGWLRTLGVVERRQLAREEEKTTRFHLNEDSDFADLLYQLEGVALKRLLEIDGALEDEAEA